MSIVFPNFFTYFCDILHNYDTFPCIQLIFQPEPFAEYRGSSRTHVRLGAWFWSAKADIFFSESLHIYTSFRSAQNHCLPDNVRPRGAFISVGDCTPTEKDLLLLTTCRSGSLLDWDKNGRRSDPQAGLERNRWYALEKSEGTWYSIHRTWDAPLLQAVSSRFSWTGCREKTAEIGVLFYE